MKKIIVVGMGKVGSLVGVLLSESFEVTGLDKMPPHYDYELPFDVLQGDVSDARFMKGLLKDFDAVIATGSSSSHKYFEYYFSKYPNLLRKTRHSVAVLDGNESDNDLMLLSNDIFDYFGLGCRSVSKLFVPKQTPE